MGYETIWGVQMGKIPVGKTIAYAYSFAFGHILNILGVAWLPFAIMGAAGYFLLMPYFNAMQQFLTTQDMSGLSNSVLLAFAFVVVAVVCIAMVTVEVMREALGMDPGQKFFYFSLDKPVWRLIGAYFLFILAMLCLGIVGGIALAVLAMIGGSASTTVAGVVTAIGTIVFVLAMILIAIRLVFLLPAVVVAENHIGLKRGWHLTYGNFWRIVVVTLAIFIPLALVQFCVEWVFLGPDFMARSMQPATSPEEMAAQFQLLRDQLQGGMIYMVPVWIIISILNLGLSSGAGAFAYRALTVSQGTVTKPG